MNRKSSFEEPVPGQNINYWPALSSCIFLYIYIYINNHIYTHPHTFSYETAGFGQIIISSETHSVLQIQNSFPNYRRNNSQSSILKKRSVYKIFLFKTFLNIVGQIGNMASTQSVKICGRTSNVTAKLALNIKCSRSDRKSDRQIKELPLF